MSPVPSKTVGGRPAKLVAKKICLWQIFKAAIGDAGHP